LPHAHVRIEEIARKPDLHAEGSEGVSMTPERPEVQRENRRDVGQESVSDDAPIT
jgi:hypothetical protein